MIVPDSLVPAQLRITTQAAQYTLVKASVAYRAVFLHLTEQSNVAFQVSAYFLLSNEVSMSPHFIKTQHIWLPLQLWR